MLGNGIAKHKRKEKKMLTEIKEDTELLLFGSVMVAVKRDPNGGVSIVAHRSPDAELRVRVAKEPYQCTLHLADGSEVMVDLGDDEDWGDIQDCVPGDCEDWEGALGWGNDEDGHIKIESVTDGDGNEIPLDEFRRDVDDFVIFYSA